MLRQLQGLVADLERHHPDFQASVKLVSDLPAVETSPDEPVVRRFAGIAAQVMGRPLAPEQVRFATEACIFLPALHVPNIIFGPGNATLAHQPDEFIEIDAMAEAARVYAAVAAELLT